jgi:DNA primase
MEHPEFTFGDSVKYLANIANVPLKISIERTKILRDVMSIYRQNLLEEPKAQQFLLDRGITQDTWFKANIGFARGIPEGIPLKDLKDVGLISEFGFPRFEERIMFALHNTEGNIVHLQGRSLIDASPKYLQLTTDTSYGRYPIGHYLYGEEQFTNQIKSALVCEGIPDTLIAQQLGFTAFGMIGNNFHKQAYKFKDTAELYLIFDNDTASQGKLIQEVYLAQSKIPNTIIKVVTLPKEASVDKMDLNKWFLETNASGDDLQDLLDKAIPAIKLLINSWYPKKHLHYSLIETIVSAPEADTWLGYLSLISDTPRESIDYLAEVIKGT